MNQGTSFESERAAGRLWAPLRTQAGARIYHWETTAEVRRGDIIVHYADGSVRGLRRAKAAAHEAERPPEEDYSAWTGVRWQVEVDHAAFDTPLRFPGIGKASHQLNTEA